MKYKIRHSTTYSYSEPVSVSDSHVRLTPRVTAGQQCTRSRIMVKPVPDRRGRRVDYYGNHVDYFSISAPHRSLTVTAHSRVEVLPAAPREPAESAPWESVAATLKGDCSPAGLDAVQFLFDSPRVQANEKLAAYARPSFAPGRPLLEAALDLTARIHDGFTYDQEATTVQTGLAEAFEARRGVCQDFAHVQIGCLRALGLAARYVSGYLRTEPPPGKPRLVGADASHAWISVYCGELGWVSLDPTTHIPVGEDHVTVAWGRDYDDVCPIQGMVLGEGHHRMTVAVDVVPETVP